MKIAHVVATFPPHIGGMGQVAFDECKKLAERGHEVTVFTLRYTQIARINGEDYPDFAMAQNRGSTISSKRNRDADSNFLFKVVRMRPSIKFGDAGWVPQLFFKLKNFDIVHLHYPWYGGAEWALFAKILREQKYVVTYHMDAAPAGFFKKMVGRIYDGLVAKRILFGAERVIAVDKAHFSASRFGQQLSPDKVVELSNAVDAEIFKPRAVSLDELGLSEWKDKKIILFVGNLLPVKRLDLLLGVVRRLGDDVRLLVVGGGNEEGRYKNMTTDYGLRTTVRFAGAVNDRGELAKYYSLATVLAVPSDAESFSLVIVEALASGCPVVASDLPGVRNKVEDGVNGFLFKPGSAENLKEQLEKVLNMPTEERKQMGERGRQKAVEKYDLDRHVEKLEEIYRRVCPPHPVPLSQRERDKG